MPRIQDQAVVLRDVEYSETSQIVVLLTQHHGKLRGLAKGSRRTAPSAIARFSGGLNPFNRGQVVATTKPQVELAAVTEWDLQNDRFDLRGTLVGQRAAAVAADLLDAFLPDADPQPAAFTLLEALLDAAAVRDVTAPVVAAALLRFQWGLLCELGYRPELDRDVRADAPLPPGRPVYCFDPQAGGLTAEERGGDWRVRAATAALLRRIAGGETIDPAAVDPDLVRRTNRLLCSYARVLLGRELPSMRLVLASTS